MKIDREIYHQAHPQHILILEYTQTPFYCDGCKEAGIGLKYKCKICEYDYHKACALASPIIIHPFYPKCIFQFQFQSPGSIPRYCNACHNIIQGFVYHCKTCGFDLHPCCASLPQVLDDGDVNFYLCNKVSGPCHYCGSKGPGWAYSSKCKNYNLHVSCVKTLLVESWEAMYLNVDKSKIREIQNRIPSLRGTLKNHHGGKSGKLRKCCQMASTAVSIIVSAILGDPTALVAGLIAGFMSK